VRVLFPAEVHFAGARFRIKEFTANLSIGGIFLPTDEVVPPLTRGTLTFRISQWEEPFTVEAEVVRVFTPGEQTYDRSAGLGIQFIDLSEQDRKRLERLVEGLQDGSIVEAIRRSIVENATDLNRELRKRPLSQKLILALQAQKEEIEALIREGNPVVIPRLLDNPRLTIPHVRTIARDPRMTATVMLAIRQRAIWMKDEEVRFAFCEHPRSPWQAVQEILATLPRAKLTVLAKNGNVSPRVREKANALLGRVAAVF
jgi:uncharacterized protein (TIGR02266 family)